MGISIWAGEHELCTKVAAYTVMGWCAPFEKREFSHGEWYDRQGTVDILADAVTLAHARVPHDFILARDTGFLNPDYFGEGKRGDLDDFTRARVFLQEAAEIGGGISGSF